MMLRRSMEKASEFALKAVLPLTFSKEKSVEMKNISVMEFLEIRLKA